jgi:hypothetical protein
MLYARSTLSLTVLLLAALAACARDQERVNPDDTPPDEAPRVSQPDDTNNASVLNNPDTAGWTAGLTAKGGSEMVTLTAVRTATHAEFERIVFAFEPQKLPGYRVEYIDRPVRQCGSGNVVELPGDAWLSIRLEPAQAHTEAGAPTIAERSRTLDYPNIKALRLICDFEGQVEWVAAVASPEHYRTLELREPARLVVDVRK